MKTPKPASPLDKLQHKRREKLLFETAAVVQAACNRISPEEVESNYCINRFWADMLLHYFPNDVRVLDYLSHSMYFAHDKKVLLEMAAEVKRLAQFGPMPRGEFGIAHHYCCIVHHFEEMDMQAEADEFRREAARHLSNDPEQMIDEGLADEVRAWGARGGGLIGAGV